MANNPKNQDEHEEKVQESSPKKELICKSVYGKVKWFNVKRGYGFVCRNDNQEDVFIHQSAIVKSNPDHPRKSVGENEEIYFDIVKGIKGNEAANVCGADGNHVKGSEYALRYQRIRFRGRGRGRGRGRTRVMSEEVDNHPQEINRGGGGGGRVFRGGRPYMVQYRRPHPGYDMPPPPPSQFYYDMPYDYYRGGPPRGRFQRGGGYRGGYREGRGGGGPPHPSRGGDVAMNFPPYEYEFMDRRPPRGGGGRGRPRFRSGRGRGRGRGGVVKDFGEERPLPHDGGDCEEDDDVCRGE